MARSLFIRAGEWVCEREGLKRMGKCVEVVYGDYGHLGSDVSHYMVELEDGSIVQFEWLTTRRLSVLDALARASRQDPK